jgi:HlyD family secretion protein
MSNGKSKILGGKMKWSLIAMFVLALSAAGLHWLGAATPPSGPPPWLQTEAIQQGDLEVTVACTGSLQAMGTVEVGTEVSGTIKNVLVDYNDQVKKGQILAELDLELFDTEGARTRAETQRAAALLRQAEAEYRRNRPLLEEGHLSAKEFLDYETSLATAKADLLTAQAAQKKAETNLRKASIRSPIDGTVIERQIEKGQTVAASFNTPTLFILAEDLDRMEIEADVDESDIGQIRQGQKVRFTVQAYPDETFSGTVSQIRLNPTEESNVVTYTVVINSDNEKGLLLPGMTATIDFIVAAADNALLAPNAALQYTAREKTGAKGPALLVTDRHGPPRRVAVTAGLSDGARTVVQSPDLRAGMMVVTGEKAEEKKSGGNLFSRLMPRPSHKRGPGH